MQTAQSKPLIYRAILTMSMQADTVRLHAIPDVNARVAMWILDGVESI